MNSPRLVLSLALAVECAFGAPNAEAQAALGSPALRTATQSPLQSISSQAAVRRALDHNSSLQVAELEVKSARQGVLSEEGQYPYYLSANAGFTRSASAQLRVDDTVSTSASRSLDAGVGVRRLFPQGTLAELRADGQYFHLDRTSTTFGTTPFADSGYGATVRATVTQPLLRGYGTRVGEAELRAAKVTQNIAEKSLRRVQSSLLGEVLSAYLELWYTSRVIEIEDESLGLTREQLQQARARLSMGAISKVDLLTFQTRASEQQEAVVAAELSRQQRSLTLSQLMGQDPPTTEWLAADGPELRDRRFSQRAVAAAMRADSVELAELEQRVRLAKTRAQVAGEVWRPRLDLEAWAAASGLSTEFPNAWARAAQGQYWSVHGGAIFDLPLSETARSAEQAQAQLAVQAAQQQLAAARTRVGADAATAIANERAARQQLANARRTTKIAEETYLADRERYDLGQTIVIEVQIAEAALRRARLREARAQVDLAQARLVLSHLTGALLDRYL